ncbi:MAG: protein kinase [Myxococcales bacterium]|nr:protein kinase [Myxococcales bacterium]
MRSGVSHDDATIGQATASLGTWNSSLVGPRSIELLALLGEGGFGKVYRGRLSLADGFRRDVAVKMLRPGTATPSLLARLRDEARTLLLLRDRAIVSAEPPIRLGDHWAVVMEFVDGLSARELLRLTGPFPVSVALEIVGEVARALDAAARQEGPNGPLNLVHRDIKSGNLQITRAGEVKILDFGAAFAEFDARESHTRSMMVVGTPGYMAPERMEGITTPASDVYALGVTLFELVVGKRPGRGRDPDLSVPGMAEAVQVSERMRASVAEKRPSARAVADRCRELSRAIGDVSLVEWARALPAREPQIDELVGHRFQLAAEESARRSRGAWVPMMAALGAVAGLTAVLGLVVLGVLAYTSGLAQIPWSPTDVPSSVGVQVAAAPMGAAGPVAELVATPEPEPVPAPSVRPAPAPVAQRAAPPVVHQEGTPDDAEAPAPVAPAPREPEPEPEPTLEEHAPAKLLAPPPAPHEQPLAPVAPASHPAPPSKPKSVAVGGEWVGSMRGLPLTLSLDHAPGMVYGKAVIDLGAQLRTEAVAGTVEPDGTLAFTVGSLSFRGTLDGGQMSGTYAKGSSRKQLPWTAERTP